MRSARYTAAALGAAVVLSLAVTVSGQGFVGETKCANPTCHGAALPAAPADDPAWRPWKSARTQWLNQNIDRHSRAYRTLTTEDSKRIAAYMGVEATSSEKCLVCHAPPAPLAADSKHRPRDGVSCEHCHGPAERWLQPHKATDWPQRRAEFASLGFYDNNDFRLRAEKCAACHVEIDHEIVAGGHPPLQFEMVAYAQVMKHWDDAEEHPGFSPDPTLWALGQIVGLRRAAEAIARRAAGSNYQSLGQFPHFADRNCYACHHKLVADAARGAAGHADMAEIAFGALFPDAQGTLTSRWSALRGAVGSSASNAQQQADGLADWLAPFAARIGEKAADQTATRQMLRRILDEGPRLSGYEVFSHTRPPGSNVLRLQHVELPWWYTTGAREQTALAIQALCPPAFGAEKCRTIFPDLRKLVDAINRSEQQPAEFAAALGAIKAKLF